MDSAGGSSSDMGGGMDAAEALGGGPADGFSSGFESWDIGANPALDALAGGMLGMTAAAALGAVSLDTLADFGVVAGGLTAIGYGIGYAAGPIGELATAGYQSYSDVYGGMAGYGFTGESGGM